MRSQHLDGIASRRRNDVPRRELIRIGTDAGPRGIREGRREHRFGPYHSSRQRIKSPNCSMHKGYAITASFVVLKICTSVISPRRGYVIQKGRGNGRRPRGVPMTELTKHEGDMNLARRYPVSVLITAPPERALEIAFAIADDHDIGHDLVVRDVHRLSDVQQTELMRLLDTATAEAAAHHCDLAVISLRTRAGGDVPARAVLPAERHSHRQPALHRGPRHVIEAYNRGVSHVEHKSHAPASVACYVLTVSDSRTPDTDTGGLAIRQLLEQAGHQVTGHSLVKDEPAQVAAQVRAQLADARTQVIITTGGTGITSRDGTYEAIDGLLEKRLDGFGELFRMLSFRRLARPR